MPETQTGAAGRSGIDAEEMLKDEHDEVKTLYHEYLKKDLLADKEAIAREIAVLLVHACLLLLLVEMSE